MKLTPRRSAKYATFAVEPAIGPHPQATAWWGSRLLMSWVTPLMRVGQHKQLDMDDIWPLQAQHRAEAVTSGFRQRYDRSQSLARAFMATFGWEFALTGIAFLVGMLCSLVGPVVLEHVVSSLTSKEFSVTVIASWVALLFAAQVTQAIMDNVSWLNVRMIAIRFSAAIKALIYAKTMRLSAQSRKDKSTAEITNMYTSDASTLTNAAYFIHQAWVTPLQIVIVSYMLFRVLNVAAFAGIGVIILMLFLNHLLSKRMFALQKVYRTSKDTRMKKVTELFKAINIVKFNAWEDKFLERVEVTRKDELQHLLDYRLYNSASIVLMWGMPVFISLVSFGFHALVLHRELTPAAVFSSISLFQLLQGPLRYVTNVITLVIQCRVAHDKVAEFLDMPEIKTDNVQGIDDACASDYIKKNVIVAIENGSFGWDDDSTLIRNVNLQVKCGEFYVIHGPVGCGKSSLCSALLGEMVKHSGSVYVGGSVAYCSQQAWIQNMTVRENILFGLPFDRKKYDKVVAACALTEDLKSLPAGDQTEIGERGVNVSGGQKARIALARACYSDASVYILDSPLSAVDAIVQNEIFQKCLLGLLRHKTIILVTHNPEIIASEHITHAVTLNELGEFVETRKAQSRPHYEPLLTPLAAHTYAKPTFDECMSGTAASVTVAADDMPTFEDMAELNEEVTLLSPYNKSAVKTFEKPHDQNTLEKTGSSGRLIEEEKRSEGRVGAHVFAIYFNAIGGMPVVIIILLTQVLWQVLQVSSDFWLGAWSSDRETTSSKTNYRLGIYAALGLGSTLMVTIRTLMITFYGLRGAKNMFDRMTKALVYAPMRFFDTNPIGRILTRYGSDIFNVDVPIPFLFGTLFATLFSVGSSILTAAIVIQWKGLLLIPVAYIYAQVGFFYLAPARELRRLAMTTQAPVLNHLSESVDGDAIIRAFGQRQITRFTSMNYDKLDENNKMQFVELSCGQWLSLRIQLLGSFMVLIVTASLVMLRDDLSPAVIGLAFSYALNVSSSLEQIVYVLASVETTMVSPERIQEYIDIPQEAPHRIAAMDPPTQPHWPAQGAVTFDKVSFRYKDGDRLVLDELSFKVAGGQKIGIVGRTGAGKSSLTMALFRINELASGSITIDGVNIGTIGLKTLREKLSIIPQNPVLFKGPLRSYLDPFDEFTDDELWQCIRRVGLTERISQEEKKLELVVEENGENFSVGERQMLCMARALLRSSRIVIFDEATAAIDHETDQRLQRVIREAFVDSTVLTIAHRLDTILDSDRILVLDGGRIVEFASPAELVQKGEGHFFELMQEGGYLDKFMAKTNNSSDLPGPAY